MSLTEQQLRNDGSSQIHVKNLDGTNDMAVTHNTWANIRPLWSADGSKIAYLSESGGTYNVYALYIMDADGSNIQKVSEPVYDENAIFTWSPDGAQIAINSAMPIGQIEIIDLATGRQHELLSLNEGETAYSPAWRP
jgi:Tol biopolymer transport system component